MTTGGFDYQNNSEDLSQFQNQGGSPIDPDKIPLSLGPQKFVPGKNYKFKVTILGDGGVGKSTFLTKLGSGIYTRRYVATVGASTSLLSLSLSGGGLFYLELWDTAGQERNRGLGDVYSVSASGAIIMSSVKSKSSMDSFLEHASNFSASCNVEQHKIVFAANKIDAISPKKGQTIIKYGRNLANQLNAEFVDMSIKTEYRWFDPIPILINALLPSDEKIKVVPNFEIVRNLNQEFDAPELDDDNTDLAAMQSMSKFFTPDE